MKRLERLVRAAARRPVLTLAVVAVLALAGAGLALGLQPSTGTDTFVSRSATPARVTADDQSHFGGDPIIVLIHEPLTDLVLTRELATLTKLEACLGGQTVTPDASLHAFTATPVSRRSPPYGGWSSPCGRLARAGVVRVVYGPGTFLNRSVVAVNQQVTAIEHGAAQATADAARGAYALALGRHETKSQALTAAKAAFTLAQQQQGMQLAQLYLNSGIKGLPRIDDANFVSQIVFDATRGQNVPKARFAYLFPTADSALVQVRLRASLSSAQQADAIRLIRRAVHLPMFALAYGGTYTVSGAPVVLDDLASRLTTSIAQLLLAAVLLMGLMLLLVFRARLRLLPLLVALAAAGITFGLSALVGASLTMASIAVLPVLIGLAVDYAVQFQSRVSEGRQSAGAESLGRVAGAPLPGRESEEAVVRATLAGVPSIGVAALATATGFLVLLLSPVPMIRGFAVLLVVGIAVSLVCALSAGSAALALAERDLGPLGAALRGAGEILRGARGSRRARPPRGAPVPAAYRPPRGLRPLLAAASAPGWVLGLGAVLAVAGWVADTQTTVQSDVTKLVPANMPALRDLHGLERVTGVSGEIDVVVHARDVATPQTIGWMISYEQGLFAHFGYLETRGCAVSTLCPALSLPDLFAAGTSGGSAAQGLTKSSIDTLLGAVPAYFRQAVITPDHREATLAFGIRLMPLARQQAVIAYMRAHLRPPGGVSAGLAGLPVLAAQADASLSSSPRRLLTLLAGLAAVGLVLLLVLRRPARVIAPLVPIALATGWSALVLFATRVPLNPMSATLGALVIAIATEFSVLLSERYRQERRGGLGRDDALAATYRSTGRAVLASGLTAIAGFGVLVLSDITMLRDFGFVTVIDLAVSLAGVLLVLPAVLALAEREGFGRGLTDRLGALTAGVPGSRRRARVA